MAVYRGLELPNPPVQAGETNPPPYISRMVHMKAHANLDELHLLGQAEVQPLEEEVEASAVEEEDSKKLSEKSESLELHRKMMDRKKMLRNHRQTTENK